MRLLVVTQVVDCTDRTLGFFHSWIEKLALHFETINVICLFEGVHNLPDNVRVHSLGKEKGKASAVTYSLRFLRLIWALRGTYDRVFVHMNQEYILLGGLYWRLAGKKVYLWRNHYAGSLLTRVSVAVSTAVFCTSTHSYTARFKKTKLMPVGVDIERFESHTAERKPNSILFLGRMTPSKKPDVLIESLILLANQGVDFSATFCGPVLLEDSEYLNKLRERAQIIGDRVTFIYGVPHTETAAIYSRHEIYVNLGASGMFDKTLFEAAASGCLVLATSEDFNRDQKNSITFIPTPDSLANALAHALQLSSSEKTAGIEDQNRLVSHHSLDALARTVASAMLT